MQLSLVHDYPWENNILSFTSMLWSFKKKIDAIKIMDNSVIKSGINSFKNLFIRKILDNEIKVCDILKIIFALQFKPTSFSCFRCLWFPGPNYDKEAHLKTQLSILNWTTKQQSSSSPFLPVALQNHPHNWLQWCLFLLSLLESSSNSCSSL